MSRAAAKVKVAERKPSPLPAPPPLGAKHATIDETCGYLRVRRSALDEIRRTDSTFPKPMLLTGGLPRFVVAELDAWLAARPRGWSSVGGLREGVLRRPRR